MLFKDSFYNLDDVTMIYKKLMSTEDSQNDADCGQYNYTEENIPSANFPIIVHIYFGLGLN